MGYLKNILSIFKWNTKTKETNYEEELKKNEVKPTIDELKKWTVEKLPPLAWERITLRSSKYLLERYRKTLNDFEPSQVLPQDVQERVSFLILEMYQKEINFASSNSVNS